MGWVDFTFTNTGVVQTGTSDKQTAQLTRVAAAARFMRFVWILMANRHPRNMRKIASKRVRVHTSDGVTNRHKCTGADLCLAPSAHVGCKNVLCMPDFDFINSMAYANLKVSIDKKMDTPWAQKTDYVHWRGASTGKVIDKPSDLRRNPRLHLCLKGKVLLRANLLLSNISQIADKATNQEIKKHKLVDRRRPIDNFLRHKYIIDDLLAVTTVFVASHNGKRSAQSRRATSQKRSSEENTAREKDAKRRRTDRTGEEAQQNLREPVAGQANPSLPNA